MGIHNQFSPDTLKKSYFIFLLWKMIFFLVCCFVIEVLAKPTWIDKDGGLRFSEKGLLGNALPKTGRDAGPQTAMKGLEIGNALKDSIGFGIQSGSQSGEQSGDKVNFDDDNDATKVQNNREDADK